MTRRILIVLVAFFLEGCGTIVPGQIMASPFIEAPLAQNTAAVIESPAPEITPSPTIGYEATTNAAQSTTVAAVQTASAAVAQQVQATNDHEARAFGVLQMTQDADHATQTAVPTFIPLTLTQQVASNILVAGDQANAAAAFTATAAYPTQLVVVADAENKAKWAPLRTFVEAIYPLFTGLNILFGFFLVFMVLKRWAFEKLPEPKFDKNEALDGASPQPQTPYTDITHIHEHNDDAETIRRIIPPLCDPEVFREWAVFALGGESIAIDKWETKDSPFQGREYRDVFYPWVIENGLKINKEKGVAILSKRGIAYCKYWITKHPLLPTTGLTPKSAPSGSE
jgi:hypothetical protein